MNSDHRAGQWEKTLKSSGFRITEPIRVILRVLAESPRALGALEIYDAGRQQLPRLGLVTVYRTLAKMEETGLLQHIHQADGCHRMAPACEGHQHLMICNRCGRLVFFTGDNMDSLFQRVADSTGFRVEDHWLQLFGLCPECVTSGAVMEPF